MFIKNRKISIIILCSIISLCVILFIFLFIAHKLSRNLDNKIIEKLKNISKNKCSKHAVIGNIEIEGIDKMVLIPFYSDRDKEIEYILRNIKDKNILDGEELNRIIDKDQLIWINKFKEENIGFIRNIGFSITNRNCMTNIINKIIKSINRYLDEIKKKKDDLIFITNENKRIVLKKLNVENNKDKNIYYLQKEIIFDLDNIYNGKGVIELLVSNYN